MEEREKLKRNELRNKVSEDSPASESVGTTQKAEAHMRASKTILQNAYAITRDVRFRVCSIVLGESTNIEDDVDDSMVRLDPCFSKVAHVVRISLVDCLCAHRLQRSACVAIADQLRMLSQTTTSLAHDALNDADQVHQVVERDALLDDGDDT
eukprot:SAG31_NODE_314_length_17854_cov_3.932075_2_plen_153_part_00